MSSSTARDKMQNLLAISGQHEVEGQQRIGRSCHTSGVTRG